MLFLKRGGAFYCFWSIGEKNTTGFEIKARRLFFKARRLFFRS
ncbi:hypothetical protein HMPREF1981_01213 [Bacteroides pyogenes F0041]|uniref:Uncharacterized protein n=1 Tax=Bacteroides pyogenes F0041 TaxID=1321819 RepID=U2C607_9BACE|nr:hypothetical protein HMPREF1981_01213 [Bacteroides pyogenes F0041]